MKKCIICVNNFLLMVNKTSVICKKTDKWTIKQINKSRSTIWGSLLIEMHYANLQTQFDSTVDTQIRKKD